jgi:hypothetical protein
LDGGGVRGIVALAFLERIEAVLNERAGGHDDVRLSDYFDLIGGTSTGGIIAVGLALGFPVARLIDMYLTLAGRGFKGSRWHGGILVPKFRSGPLRDQLKRHVGDETLGSDKLLTGLALVAKRLDTGSVWVFHNNPRGRYFNTHGEHQSVPNRDLRLTDILRASTAAPTYFAPELIEVAPGVRGAFVDGGVSPYHNPSLQLLMLANLTGYGFSWPLGAEELLLTSVGTGVSTFEAAPETVTGWPSAILAARSLQSVLLDCTWQTQTLLQWMGACATPWTIDSEVGDLAHDDVGGTKLLTYLRFDIRLEAAWLRDASGIDMTQAELARLAQMDRPETVEQLLEIGRAAAARQVESDYFPSRFDVETA